jgi:hypothetical protein
MGEMRRRGRDVVQQGPMNKALNLPFWRYAAAHICEFQTKSQRAFVGSVLRLFEL